MSVSNATAIPLPLQELLSSVKPIAGGYNVAIGRGAGANLTTGWLNFLLGENAGADLTVESGLVIIGDNVRDNVPEHNKNCIFIGYGERIVLGPTLFGKPTDYGALKACLSAPGS